MQIVIPSAIVQYSSPPQKEKVCLPEKCDQEILVTLEIPVRELSQYSSVFNTEIIIERKVLVSQSCSPIRVLSPARSILSSPKKDSLPKKEYDSVMT